ncbi:MAG: bifunctional histidinol-phosphatase/imidazoleglycerol-phosphate dehydratase HisB [Bacteroidales bacterium]|jgi:imidazoleglycerol-phosphate dehydratase/histidinol-phosphatase|nr:bifunctional histidinol-phosphatase/imidazoleglycerol-phosphate dehydratase HisB [Bacteroidales bacterium]
MKKVLFIDRDGTIIEEPADEQVDSLEKLSFMKGAICSLSRISRETDYELVIVTNQDGLGTASFPEENFWPAHNKMLSILRSEGIEFKEIFIDRTTPEQRAPTRKPGTAMLGRYLAGGVDLSESFVIGDRLSDVELAGNLGCRAILLKDVPISEAVLCTTDWKRIASFLCGSPRTAMVSRNTSETAVEVEINLDGSGNSRIRTGIGFLDHMLSQVARHGSLDVRIAADGDLHVDEHHTIEDVAITLGDAVNKALGGRKGIERYSFVLPMDDSLAMVALDLGGRQWLEWDVEFTGEKIGEMPTEMFFHFFKSFSDSARCNLNIKVTGSNDHHKAEALFKAFGKALRSAVSKTGNPALPSTKELI